MALQNIPVALAGFKLMVTEAPTVKMRELAEGVVEPVVDRNTGLEQYVVVLFAKPLPPADGRRPGKGEEIRVNLPADPGPGFKDGDYVELVGAVVNTYEMRNDANVVTASGLWWRAEGLKPVYREAAA